MFAWREKKGMQMPMDTRIWNGYYDWIFDYMCGCLVTNHHLCWNRRSFLLREIITTWMITWPQGWDVNITSTVGLSLGDYYVTPSFLLLIGVCMVGWYSTLFEKLLNIIIKETIMYFFILLSIGVSANKYYPFTIIVSYLYLIWLFNIWKCCCCCILFGTRVLNIYLCLVFDVVLLLLGV